MRILYISDMDGTLLTSSKEISTFTRDTLNAIAEKGCHFSVATARSAATAVPILGDVKLRIPVILMNGAAIYDLSQRKYIKVEPISIGTTESILNTLGRYEITGFMYTVADHKLITYYENLGTKALEDFHDERRVKYNKDFRQVHCLLQQAKESEIIYFTLIDEYERLEKVAAGLRELDEISIALYRDVYSESLWFLEIHSAKASKHHAAKFLREYGQFDKVIGFGDNLNDIPLFKACDECYAVANAVKELKEKATGIIGDNNSDGVAKFLAKRVLIERTLE